MSDISKYLEKAERLLLKGKHQDALKELQRACEEDPRNTMVRLKTADLCSTLHRTAEAAQHYGRVFDSQASIGDVTNAALTYKKIALLQTPEPAQTLRYAALVERTSRDEALAAYRSALQQLQEAPREALEVQRKIVALAPSAPEWARIADLEAAAGDRDAAGEALLQAAELANSTGDNDVGFEYLRRAVDTDRSNRRALLMYGSALSERRHFSEAARVLGPLAQGDDAEAIALYARALLESGRAQDAEPYFWAQYERDRSAITSLGELMERHVAAGNSEAALAMAHRLEVRETGHRRRRDFILLVKDIVLRHPPQVELLAYLAELLNSANREHDYCEVLGRLFDLYFASGQFLKAADALDRAGEVDPYDAANQRRLASLRGKVDERRFGAVAARFGKAPPPRESEGAAASSQPNVLEDLMLQAEIFLQYGMRARALERLQRIQRLFPGEEGNNAGLRKLFERAAIVPEPAKVEQPAVARSPAVRTEAAAPPAAARPTAASGDELARIAEIGHSIFRQAHVEAVLFAAAHDIGRFFGAIRCIAALCAPGAPPSAFVEYCAPGVTRSEIEGLAELVISSSKALRGEPIVMLADGAAGGQEVAVTRLSVRDEFTGVLIASRPEQPWSTAERSALTLLAGQVALSASSARLRKMLEAVAPREERTGLLKRGAFWDALSFELTRALQNRRPVTLALVRFAHTPAEALDEAVQLLLAYTRQSDVTIRYDRSTIALVLGNTNEGSAARALSKLRKVLEREKSTHDIRIFCGAAEALLRPDFEIVDIAIEVANRAEKALGAALREGAESMQLLPQPA